MFNILLRPKYNILLVINQKYYELAKIFVTSLFKNADVDKIGKIFIADIGLNMDSSHCLENLSPKVSIIETGVMVEHSKDAHTSEWIEAVSLKTNILYNFVCSEDNLPLIMVDADMFVVKDFSHVIDQSKDIQVCKRAKPVERLDMIMEYIGSFLIVNNIDVLQFIKAWITRIKERIDSNTIPPFETPALCEVIVKYQNKLQIGLLDENEISCANNLIDGTTCIIHMKSEVQLESKNLAIGRIKEVSNYSHTDILKCLNCNFLTIDEYLLYKQTRKAKVAIYTAITGEYDNLIQHTYISKDFDYICFTDRPVTDPGIWEIRPIGDFNLNDIRRAKYYKIFPNEVLSEYDYSIWVDGNIDVLGDELEKRVNELIRDKVYISANIHDKRDCIYEEANASIRLAAADPDIILKQVAYLREKGFPEKTGLFETSILFRRHNDIKVRKIMQDWWWMLTNYSFEDQLSFDYILYKNQMKCEKFFNENARSRKDFLYKPHNKIIFPAMYLDIGNGYNDKEVFYLRIAVDETGQFQIVYELEKYIDIKSLRFNPFQNNWGKVKINKIRVYTNENKIINLDADLMTFNSNIKDDGFIVFYNYEPMIEYSIAEGISKVEICGVIKLIDNRQKEQVANALLEEYNSIKKLSIKLIKKIINKKMPWLIGIAKAVLK